MKKMLYAATIASVLFSAGCTGSFTITNSIYKWHSSFDDRTTDEIAFLACAIFQVYAFAILGDAIIFNSIQFWSQDYKNPLASTIQLSNGDQILLTSVDAETMKITSDKGEYLLRKTDTGVEAVAADGTIYHAVLKTDGVDMTSGEHSAFVPAFAKL